MRYKKKNIHFEKSEFNKHKVGVVVPVNMLLKTLKTKLL